MAEEDVVKGKWKERKTEVFKFAVKNKWQECLAKQLLQNSK